jgi:hypothetical protein
MMVTGSTSKDALIAAFREAQAKRNEISNENRQRILNFNEEGESFNDVITKILDEYEQLKL